MYEIGKKIAKLRKEKNLTQTELDKLLKLTKQTIIKYEAEKTPIPIEVLTKISLYFNFPIEAFFSDKYKEKIKNETNLKSIPIIPIVYSDMTDNLDNIPFVIDWYEFPISLVKNADYATIQDNDSMEPKIYEDDLILIERMDKLENGNIGLFKLNEKVICKRFYKNLITGEILLKSDNLTVDPIKITKKDSFKIIGKIVGIFDYNL